MLRSKALLFSLALVAAYLLVGYFAVPQLVQPRLEQYVFSHLGRELRFEDLRVDPLSWSVRLDAVDLVAGQDSLWPGVTMSAATADLRFNFWRLSPSVSMLTLQQPMLVVDTTAAQVPTNRYPFVGLWQQWQQGIAAEIEQPRIPIKRWHVEAGQVLFSAAGSQAAGEVLLDNIFLQADPQTRDGLRAYSLSFASNGNVDIESNGQFSADNLSATGQYQLKIAPAIDGSMAELQVEGAFSSEFLADAMRIDLTESQLHSAQFATCILNQLLCAAVSPLDAGFASSLVAASDGIRILQANGQLSAFQLNASLGQGQVPFVEALDFASARIQLVLPLAASLDGSDQGAERNFFLQLNEPDNDQYQIGGQLDIVSQAVDARFLVNGRQDVSGTAQLQRVGQQQSQGAYSQLDLQLENPGASLAREFMEQNFTAALVGRTLRMQLTATLDELGLRLRENFVLAQPGLVPNSSLDSSSAPEASSAALDAEWLLALLQNPDELIEFAIPELTVNSTTSNFRDLLRQQALATLTELTEQPFVGLAKALNVSKQNLHEIRFAPGSAALGTASTETIADLASILLQRPGLGISVAGVYDPLLDKKALQIEQLRTHIALAAAADLVFRTGAEPPDFSDPVVHSVIDEFARRRVPSNVMQQFVAQYGPADADQGVLPEGDVAAYYSTLFDLLVDYAEIPQSAMTALARYRAQAVIDALEDAGVSRERLEAAAQTTSDARADAIPLPLQLTAWPGGNGNSNIGSAEFGESQPEILQ